MSNKRIENIFVDTLYRSAVSEQNIANRLYKGESSKESYLVATVSAQVLRNVAQALEQAINIHRGSFTINMERTAPEIQIPQSVLDRLESTAPEDRAVNQDPDIFRTYLKGFVEAVEKISEQESVPKRVLHVKDQCQQVLDKNSISPARKIKATYTRLLKECLTELKHCEIFISSREIMHSDGIRLHRELIGRLEEILR